MIYEHFKWSETNQDNTTRVRWVAFKLQRWLPNCSRGSYEAAAAKGALRWMPPTLQQLVKTTQKVGKKTSLSLSL